MYSEVVFKMSEERFYGICVLRDIRPVYELEHIRDGTFQVDIRLSHPVMGVGNFPCLNVYGFLSYELPVFLMPVVKFPEPEYPVVVCSDAVYLPDNPPEHNAGRSPRMLRQPGQALTFYVYEASLPEGVWASVFDCPDYILAAIRCETRYRDTYLPEHYQI